MDQQTIIADLEARAKALSVPISRICFDAGVHPTTFSRWKLSARNSDPIGASLKSLTAIDTALRSLEATPSARARETGSAAA